jgi:hypothetical protein
MLLLIGLQDVRQRPIVAEVLVRQSSVELRCQERVMGVADREHLRSWITKPSGKYTYDDVTWLCRDDGLYLSLTDLVPGHPLASHVIDDLRAGL